MKAVGGSVYRVGQSARLYGPGAGGSDDWAKNIGIKYSYTIELRDKGDYGFELPPRYIKPTANEAIAFIRTVARRIVSTQNKKKLVE